MQRYISQIEKRMSTPLNPRAVPFVPQGTTIGHPMVRTEREPAKQRPIQIGQSGSTFQQGQTSDVRTKRCALKAINYQFLSVLIRFQLQLAKQRGFCRRCRNKHPPPCTVGMTRAQKKRLRSRLPIVEED